MEEILSCSSTTSRLQSEASRVHTDFTQRRMYAQDIKWLLRQSCMLGDTRPLIWGTVFFSALYGLQWYCIDDNKNVYKHSFRLKKYVIAVNVPQAVSLYREKKQHNQIQQQTCKGDNHPNQIQQQTCKGDNHPSVYTHFDI